MRHSSRTLPCVALSLTVVLGASLVHAQAKKKQPQELDPVNLQGKIVAVQRGLIKVVNDENQEGLIQIDPEKTKVNVTGTALRSVLRNGMFVRFSGRFKRGTATEPIEMLQIFEPTEGLGIGVFPDDPTDPNSETVVAGPLRGFKKGKLTIAAGNEKVQAVLAETAEITLEVSDYSIVQAGDNIEVLGYLFAPGKVIATEVYITLAKPLGEPEKKPRKRRSTRGRKKKVPKSEDE